MLRVSCAVTLLVLAAGSVHAGERDGDRFFEARVRPLLVQRCGSCHVDKARGGLALTSRTALLRGGETGPAVVPGKPKDSLLLRTLRHEEEGLEMPMSADKLPAAEIAVFTRWIELGAPWPASGEVRPPAPVAGISKSDRAFWAYQPLARVKVPAVRDRRWPRTDLDRFVLAALERKGLRPAPDADAATLLRRTTHTLTGLPPTPYEQATFQAAARDEARAALVDRLLASPAYGERWARHWLDLMHYADADVDDDDQQSVIAAHAHGYRDWVIDALNRDLPYDQFVTAHIAGDLSPHPQATAAATGWAVLGPWLASKDAEIGKREAEMIADRVDTLTRGVLGLTVACARCHDHKYDPIPTADYYALAGVFMNTRKQELSLADAATTRTYEAHRKQVDAIDARIKKGLEAARLASHGQHARATAAYLLAAWDAAHDGVAADRLSPAALARLQAYLVRDDLDHSFLGEWPKLRTRDEARAFADNFQKLVEGVLDEKVRIDRENRRRFDEACGGDKAKRVRLCRLNVEAVAMDRERKALYLDLFENTRDFSNEGFGSHRGVFWEDDATVEAGLDSPARAELAALRRQKQALVAAAPAAPAYVDALAESVRDEPDMPIHVRGNPENPGPVAPRRFLTVLSEGAPATLDRGSGRAQLAAAVVGHPLVARVMANRVWALHFGRGLVATPSNFGALGARPSHPELLEYLAGYLVDHGWSLKALHRLILTSRAFGLASDVESQRYARHVEQDPDATLLWRARRRRLDVEEIRDALLVMGGKLDRSVGGPSFTGLDQNTRRTLYTSVNRFALEPMMALFDFPDPALPAEQRQRTNVPSQGLFFLNAAFVRAQCEAVADRLLAEPDANLRTVVRDMFLHVVARPPSSLEDLLVRRFLSAARRGHGAMTVSTQSSAASDLRRAVAEAVRALVASNAFLFVD